MKRHDPRLSNFAFVQRLRADRAFRDLHRLYLVEGVRFVAAAVDRGRRPSSLVVAPALLESPVGQMIARRTRQAGVPQCRVSAEQFAELSLLGQPQGIAAVLPQRVRPLPRRAGRGLWLAVEEVRSPGNLGAILRTAAAVGARGLIALSGGVDPFEPRVIRSTMGAHGALSMHRSKPAELAAWARAKGARIIGADAERGADYRSERYDGPTVLMLGAERRGMSETQKALCDGFVQIPMSPAVDSLNLANATSVLLYEAYRQRHPVQIRARTRAQKQGCRSAQRPMRSAAAPKERKTCRR